MNTFTDTDLTVLEGLDFAPPCDPIKGGCDATAEFVVIGHNHVCGCPTERFVCPAHLRANLAHIATPSAIGWRCVHCGNVRSEPLSAFVIDRIVAL